MTHELSPGPQMPGSRITGLTSDFKPPAKVKTANASSHQGRTYVTTMLDILVGEETASPLAVSCPLTPIV